MLNRAPSRDAKRLKRLGKAGREFLDKHRRTGRSVDFSAWAAARRQVSPSAERKEAELSTRHVHQTNHLDARAVFRRRSPTLDRAAQSFGNSADEYLKVHHRARLTRTSPKARVASGSGSLRLVRSQRFVMKTTDSNIWGGRPAKRTFTRAPRKDRCRRRRGARRQKPTFFASRGVGAGLVLGPLGKSVWKHAFEKPSRPSKP